MKTSPILEEVWRTKDELAREAAYDVHRFFEELRRWSQENPHGGRVIRNAEELRRLAAEQERQRSDAPTVLNDKPPRDNEKEGQA